jgi:pimeloyl-ACP methyl ester carboxylesterase
MAMSSLRTLAAIVALFGPLTLAPGALRAEAPQSKTFDAKGVKIHYLVAGKGEPVVLIHGLLSSAGINWVFTGVLGDLARDHQVIALDLPGHGWSDKPENEEAFGLRLVEDVILLLDHLKIKKAHVVGYSLGGMIAAKLMATYPERVLSGTLGGMGWFREGSGLQAFWEKLGDPRGKGKPNAFVKSIAKLAVSEDELKKIAVPVRVLVGDKDICKQLYVEPLQRVRKDWPVVEIEDADHFTCIVKKQFREEIIAWVNKNSK